MPYPSRELLRLALQTLEQRYSPLLLVSLPCMLSKGIPTCSSGTEARERAIRFGAAEETEWLDDYFRLRGGPAGKPYFMPGTGEWVQERYPGRALQRRRKDFDGTVFYHPDQQRWALRENAVEVLQDKVLEDKPLVPLAALMTWMWRDKSVESLEEGLRQFMSEIEFDSNGLVGTIYSSEVPPDFIDAGLADEPPSPELLAELTGAQLPAPSLPSFDKTIEALEEALANRNFVGSPGLVERILSGWLVGDVVVLLGPAGCGKTYLARSLGQALGDLLGPYRFHQAFLEIPPHYDITQFLGYQNLAGTFTPGRFAEEVLFVGEPTDPRLVVLDEWNLAQIDSYFAPVLSVVESKVPAHLPGSLRLKELTPEETSDLLRAQPNAADGQWILPEDTFFLATCNSWLDEPETRLPISGPAKRRCRIITMPNVLARRLQESGVDGLKHVADELLTQERKALDERERTGSRSTFDVHRTSRLREISVFSELHDATATKLLALARILLENPLTRDSFTIGIFRDVLLTCVYARAGEELRALGQEVADKVLHQIKGDPKVLESISQATRDLPNSDEISEMVRRMGAFTGERQIRPLV